MLRATRLRFLLFFCFVFTGYCHATTNIVVLGDSLSAGYHIPAESSWVSLLEKKLKATDPQLTVINSSVVGDATANGLQRLPSLLDHYHPDIVIIELGANDGLRRNPILSIHSNLDRLIQLCLNAKSKVLLIGIQLPIQYGPQYREEFADIFSQLSKEHTIPLVPFLLDKVAGNAKLMQSDGLHPSADAQPIVLDNVWPYLLPLLPKE